MHAFLPLLLGLFVFLLFRKLIISKKRQRPCPPGPKPKPIIGNAFDIPTTDLSNVYIKWGKKYNSESNYSTCPFAHMWAIGSIVHTRALACHFAAVNKLEAAIELLDRRAGKYSDRPEYPILKLWDNTQSAIKSYLTLSSRRWAGITTLLLCDTEKAGSVVGK